MSFFAKNPEYLSIKDNKSFLERIPGKLQGRRALRCSEIPTQQLSVTEGQMSRPTQGATSLTVTGLRKCGEGRDIFHITRSV